MEDNEVMMNEEEVIENDEETNEETESGMSTGAKTLLLLAGAGVAAAGYGAVKLGRWAWGKLKTRKAMKEEATEEIVEDDQYSEADEE